MKKKYIRPESRLYAINLSENIASSGGTYGDVVNGSAVIKFTHGGDNCRAFYSGYTNAVNTLGNSASFVDYYNELFGIATGANPNPFALVYCYRPF